MFLCFWRVFFEDSFVEWLKFENIFDCFIFFKQILMTLYILYAIFNKQGFSIHCSSMKCNHIFRVFFKLIKRQNLIRKNEIWLKWKSFRIVRRWMRCNTKKEGEGVRILTFIIFCANCDKEVKNNKFMHWVIYKWLPVVKFD